MKKVNRIVLGIIIILLILMCIAVLVFIKSYNSQIGKGTTETKNIEKEKSIETFLINNELINNFYNYINSNNTLAAYSILESKYIQENQITENNILSKIEKIQSYTPVEMYSERFVTNYYQSDVDSNIFTYIKGKVLINNQEENNYIVLIKDNNNSTYSIRFIDQQEFNDILEKKSGYVKNTVIEENQYNNFEIRFVTTQERCSMHFEQYINLLKNNINKAYTLLEEDYSKDKFNTIEDFKKYIEDNIEDLNNLKLTEYSISPLNTCVQYICKDNYGNTYIFEEVYPMEYTVRITS